VSPLRKSQRAPLLCYVTDRRSLVATEAAETWKVLLQKIEDAAAAGVDWIQIREKDLSGKECSLLALEALQRTANSAARAAVQRATRTASSAAPSSRAKASATRAQTLVCILLNDRLDVALAVQAGGVHLGEKSLPPQEARRLVVSLHREKNFLIGVSCHSLEAAKAAERGGADYLFFGPVFGTPAKAAYGAPQGLALLAEVCRAVGLPVLAIGGITLQNCAACLSAGASGIAAIRLFQDATDLPVLVQALRKLAT
jgi:thiamine-phosphate pyrophosphorylase